MRMWFIPWFVVRLVRSLAVMALSCAGATFAGVPIPSLTAASSVVRIKLDTPTLAPMTSTRLCLTYADACKARGRRSVKPADLAGRDMDALKTVNAAIVIG